MSRGGIMQGNRLQINRNMRCIEIYIYFNFTGTVQGLIET